MRVRLSPTHLGRSETLICGTAFTKRRLRTGNSTQRSNASTAESSGPPERLRGSKPISSAARALRNTYAGRARLRGRKFLFLSSSLLFSRYTSSRPQLPSLSPCHQRRRR